MPLFRSFQGIAVLLLFMTSLQVLSHSVQRSVPPKYTFELSENFSQLQESDVVELFQYLQMQYGRSIGNRHDSLSANFDWNQKYIGAGSNLLDGEFSIMLFGGLVRARFMNFGALAATLCHELGHRLGGEPFQVFAGQIHWSSAEGQADHFAATECLPNVYRHYLKLNPEKLSQEFEPASEVVCLNSPERKKCLWVATSGMDLIQFLQVYFDLDQPFADPLKAPLESVKETLKTAYPSYQCRMEIFKQGAACQEGIRCPRHSCWFKTEGL